MQYTNGRRDAQPGRGPQRQASRNGAYRVNRPDDYYRAGTASRQDVRDYGYRARPPVSRPPVSRPPMQSGGRPPVRRPAPRRRANRSGRLALLAIAVVLLVIGIVFLNAVSVVGIRSDTFYPGISVNGINLSGYTYDGAVSRVTQLTDEWLARSYTFTWGDRSWDFSAATIEAKIDVVPMIRLAYNIGHVGGLFQRKNAVQMLKKNPVSYTASIQYDESLLDAFIDGIASQIDVDPVEAQIVIDEVKPVVVSGSQTGLTLDREGLKQNILNLLNTGEGYTQLVVNVAEPALSSEDAAACTELIVYYQTDTTFRNMKSTGNVRLALSNFNGFPLYPGDQFSFNEVVGDRSIERGYVEATEFAGTRTQLGIGGGVCQASSTLYGALLKAGITPVVRSSHTMTVSYVSPSIDAAVAYGTKDLVMRNDTEFPVFVYTNVSGGFATVRVYGHKPQYRIELESNILSTIPAGNTYVQDKEGKYTHTEGEYYLYSDGKDGCRSEGWLVYYDWDTGEEVERVQLSTDYYYAQDYVYYVGTHVPVGSTTDEY